MSTSAYAFAIVNDLFDEDLDPDLFDDAEGEALFGAGPSADLEDGSGPVDPRRVLQ